MRTRNSFIPGIAAALLLAGLAGTAAAEAPAADTTAAPPPGAHGHPHGAGPQMDLRHILRQLNLTPEQKTQVDSILSSAKPQMQAHHATSVANREKLMVLSPSDPAYPAAVAAVQADASSGVKLAADLKTQVYAVLTPEQQAKIPEIQATAKAQIAARRAEWRAAHGGSAPPPSGVQ